jgi:protein-S-isoprenylcysteine O-methyltransferase Ste14
MVDELVDRILLVRPSPKASCGTANLDLSGCPNCRRHFACSTNRLVAVRSSVVATWLSRHVRVAGDHVNRPLLHLVGAHLPWAALVRRYHAQRGHKIIDRGPYAFIRHPIYTGLVVALFATAAVEATVPALVGAALMIFGFWLKAYSEEQFLRIELGPESYRAYCRRVPMLVPFITPGERSRRRPRANQ